MFRRETSIALGKEQTSMANLGPRAPIEKILCRIPEACRRLEAGLGVPVRPGKLQTMMDEGQLDAVVLGRQTFIHITSIDRFIDEALHQRGRRAAPMPERADVEQPAAE
jgi:hypothetical protein